MKLTKSQQQQIEMLSDGKWHNTNNNGVRGLRHNSLDVLIKKGLVVKKTTHTDTQGVYSAPSLSPEVGVCYDGDYDKFYKLVA